MNITALLQALKLAGITLEADGDNLKLYAPKGTLSAALRAQLVAHKQAIIAWLGESATDDGEPLPVCTPDPGQRYAPFPLSDLQLGFYMADDPYMEFHVRPHYYLEKNYTDLDVNRYQRAWNVALLRHRHEIVTVNADGMLEMVRDPVSLPVRCIDLRQ